RRLGRILRACHGGEANHKRCSLPSAGKHLRPRIFLDRLVPDFPVSFEISERSRSAGVHNALRDLLPVEVADLLNEVVVFQRSRSAVADGADVLIIMHGMTLT